MFSNRQATQQLQLAERLMRQGDAQSLDTARKIYLSVLQSDGNSEHIYTRLSHIAEFRQHYPEVAYYRRQALRLNPLNRQHAEKYIEALCQARQFQQLETFLLDFPEKNRFQEELLIYAGYRNGNGHLHSHRLEQLHQQQASPLLRLSRLLHEQQAGKDVQGQGLLQELCHDASPFISFEARLSLAQQQVIMHDLDEAERNLRVCAQSNFFAAAPSLAKFLATFRSFQAAIPVYESYLQRFQDPVRAMRLGEIHALLRDLPKLRQLLDTYQRQRTKNAMLSCYYFEALIALTQGDMPALRHALKPLHNTKNALLFNYMALCVALHDGNEEEVIHRFQLFSNQRPLLDFPQLALHHATAYLQKKLTISAPSPELVRLAQVLHDYHPQPLTAHVILRDAMVKHTLAEKDLKQALLDFPADLELKKIAIEYYLRYNPKQADELLKDSQLNTPGNAEALVFYRIIRAQQLKDWDLASKLFQRHLTPDRLDAYWSFAVSTQRLTDLKVLQNHPDAGAYRQFCQAEQLYLQGEIASAMDLFATAPAQQHLHLLFHAARRLGMNGRPQDALRRYAEFPPRSRFALPVLLNTSELLAETQRPQKALETACKAWQSAPHHPAAQLCYADKLSRTGHRKDILKVITMPVAPTSFKTRLQDLWLTGMEAALQDAVHDRNWTNLGELLRTLELFSPDHPLFTRYSLQLPTPKDSR